MSDLNHCKLIELRAAVAGQDWETARRLADELLGCHGHESGEEASLAFLTHGYSAGHVWPVWNEACAARNLPEVVKVGVTA